MTQNAALQEEVLPTGGIADFIMDDAEIEALEKQETIEAFGDKGIANFDSIARRMASYGRHGDDTVAHVETGELVIPKALIQGNDKLKESIFDHLRELGVEDPERYIVGSGENSINPETGLPEFFFKKIFRAAKKAVSSVARAVKKTIKGVGKILKKAAPILLTIGLTPFVGPVYAGAISGGIGSLLNGGNLKDALRTAALGGVTGAIGAGISGSLSGGVSGAISNVKSALNPNLLSSGFSRLGGVLTGQEAFSAREFLPKFLQDEKAVTAGAPADSIREGILPDNLAAEPIPTDQGEFFFDAPVAKAAPQNLEAFGLAPDPSTPPIEFGTSADLVQTPPKPIPAPIPKPDVPFRPGSASERLIQRAKEAEMLRNLPAGGLETRAPGGIQTASLSPEEALRGVAVTTGPDAPVGSAAPSSPALDTGVSEQSRLFNLMQDRAAAQNLIDAQFSPDFSSAPVPEASILDQIKQGASKASDLLFGKSPTSAEIVKKTAELGKLNPSLGSKELVSLAKTELGPNLFRRVAPTAALGLGAAYAGGFFDTPDPPSPEQTAAEYRRYLTAAGYPEDYSTYFYNPDGTRTEEGKKYLVGGLQAPSVASMGGFDAGAMAPARTFEDGGDVFPRRTGGIGPNEGIPNEDSVRAMLMPGEFVMTTDAVRGADPTGQGNINNGISTMYDMMSNLEMRGRSVA